MCDSLYNRLGALGGVAGLEDSGTNEHTVDAQLHHQRCICGRRHTTCGKVHDGQASQHLRLTHQLNGSADFLGVHVQLVVVHRLEPADLSLHGPTVTDGLYHIAGSCLSLGADHGCSLRNAAKGLSEIAATAHERNGEVVLVDVMHVISGREDLRLIDVIYANGFQNLGFHKVTDTRLGHDRDSHGFLDFLDHGRVAHACHSPLLPDVRWHAFQCLLHTPLSAVALDGQHLRLIWMTVPCRVASWNRRTEREDSFFCGYTYHHCNSTGFLRNACLFDVDNVHDDPTLEHLGESDLQRAHDAVSRRHPSFVRVVCARVSCILRS
mmetsp:Transcript_10164/g.61886  ORF Transcript_10164/g.61886 Transcript_10164/m.61886 type:complete len:323 (-) Transcript_10164:528-1496(-)